MSAKKIPLRMCVSCRELKEKKSMLRVVKGQDRTGRYSLIFLLRHRDAAPMSATEATV